MGDEHAVVRGFSPEAIAEFCRRADERKAELRADIAEAEARRDEALAALTALHDLAETRARELEAILVDGERRAVEIVHAARADAEATVRAAHERIRFAGADGPLLDLTGAPLRELQDASFEHVEPSDFFDYLRGAGPVARTAE